MSGTLEYLPSAGRLRGPFALIGGLVRAVGGEGDATHGGAEPSAVDEALAEAGAGTLDELDGPLARTVSPLRTPVFRMRIERDDDVALVWASPTVACFVTPIEPSVAQIVGVPTGLLPGALARFLRISPRPRLSPAAEVAVPPEELAGAIATGRAPAGVPPGDGRDVLARSLAELRSHWRATSSWPAIGPEPGGRTVEVVDTDAGMWRVVPDERVVTLSPTTPTRVMLDLCELVPRDEELGVEGVGRDAAAAGF